MSEEPILIIQMRRMGDLILTFPLLLDLRKKYPGHPFWIVAEPQFFQPLMPFAPEATFFPPSALPNLAKLSFRAIINLSNEDQAAFYGAQADSDVKIGAFRQNDSTSISGFWQLYRSCLTANNRHNLFHWADLFRLDFGFPLQSQAWRLPGKSAAGRIGLFLGASEESKRPGPDFWRILAKRLLNKGFRPVLLGGPEEKETGALTARNLQIPNFCGKTDLKQLAALLSSLELFVAPDTGPMHLGDWLGVPVLNLSLGNVSPHETGPLSPGQWIVQSTLSCAGCWRCWRPDTYCHNSFHAKAIAETCAALMEKRTPPEQSGLALWQSGRDDSGLYTLKPLEAGNNASATLDLFWKEAFLHFAGFQEEKKAKSVFAKVANNYPALAKAMNRHMESILIALHDCQKKGVQLPDDFWKRHPWHSRLFAGFSQMSLQNGNYGRQSRVEALQRAAKLREIFSII